MGGAVAVDQAFERNPLDTDPCIPETMLQGLGLPAHRHDVARGDGEIVVGIVHLVVMVDGNDLETAVLEILYER